VEFGVPDFQTSPYVKWIYYIYVQHTNIHVIYTYIYIYVYALSHMDDIDTDFEDGTATLWQKFVDVGVKFATVVTVMILHCHLFIWKHQKTYHQWIPG
jgi:hypothetical protein